MVTAWRWLLAAAVVPLVLAGCTSSTGPPGAGTGTAGRPAGYSSAAPGGHRRRSSSPRRPTGTADWSWSPSTKAAARPPAAARTPGSAPPTPQLSHGRRQLGQRSRNRGM